MDSHRLAAFPTTSYDNVSTKKDTSKHKLPQICGSIHPVPSSSPSPPTISRCNTWEKRTSFISNKQHSNTAKKPQSGVVTNSQELIYNETTILTTPKDPITSAYLDIYKNPYQISTSIANKKAAVATPPLTN